MHLLQRWRDVSPPASARRTKRLEGISFQGVPEMRNLTSARQVDGAAAALVMSSRVGYRADMADEMCSDSRHGMIRVGQSMTAQASLFERAAECERLMDAASDPEDRETIKLFRDMWIMLANGSATMSANYMIKQIADIERLQRGLRR